MNNTEELKTMPTDKLVFIPIGGSTGIGMNCFAYGYRGKWLLVDCGIGFPGDNLPGVDVLLPNPRFFADKKKDIVGLVVTHAHEDHIGAIHYLWHDLQCPIYVTPFANEILEDKLDSVGLLGRAVVHVVQQGSVLDLAPFEVEFVSMNHSLPEPNALAIRTAAGLVVHTGDWKWGPNPKENEAALSELGKEGVLALVCSSTNVFSEPTDKTEQDVCETLTRLIGTYAGRQIAITCFSSNIARLESIYQAARRNGKEVCLLGRSLWRMDAAARATGYLKGIPEFLSEEEALQKPLGAVVYICTGSQGQPFSALNNLAAVNPTKNAVYFGADDVVIFSSIVIPGNEKPIAQLQRRLKTKGVKIITTQEELVHVSGHYKAAEDLERLYVLLKPHISLPVHGDPMGLIAHVELAKEWGVPHAFALEDGEVLTLEKTPAILGEVPTGVLAVDGKRIIRPDAEVIRKRRKMMDDGSLVVTLVLDKNARLLGEPQLSAFGLLDDMPEDKEKLLRRVAEQAALISADQRANDTFVQNAVRTAIRQFLGEFYGKKPLIEIHLIRI